MLRLSSGKILSTADALRASDFAFQATTDKMADKLRTLVLRERTHFSHLLNLLLNPGTYLPEES
jgi:hypothetical protein